MKLPRRNAIHLPSSSPPSIATLSAIFADYAMCGFSCVGKSHLPLSIASLTSASCSAWSYNLLSLRICLLISLQGVRALSGQCTVAIAYFILGGDYIFPSFPYVSDRIAQRARVWYWHLAEAFSVQKLLLM